MSEPPRIGVLRAYGVDGDAQPQRLTGGQGVSWQVGNLVLKPGAEENHQRWLGETLATITQRGFRLAETIPAREGRWTVDGWGATRFVPDLRPATDLTVIVAAGRAFHAAVARLDRPSFLDQRDDQWARADRVAWSTEAHSLDDPLVRQLACALGTPGELGPDQLVHGDLAGNVLTQPMTSDPVIIDISPYWRPAAYADGIVIADAMVNQGAPATVADGLGIPREAVARGLLFRLLSPHDTAGFAAAVDALGL